MCISLSVALDILPVAHSKGHPRFFCYYKIITHFWFIYGLIKLFCTFIYYCLQYLTLQTRWYTSYKLLQPIESSPILFFILILDFVLLFPLSKVEYNAIMSLTCKFSKRVTLIKGLDNLLAEQWAHAFFNKLDWIDWGISEELITNWDPKFLSKFWIVLFTKLEVKLLYSTAYHL